MTHDKSEFLEKAHELGERLRESTERAERQLTERAGKSAGLGAKLRGLTAVAKNATTDEVETAVGCTKPPVLRVVDVFASTPRDAGGMVAGRTEYFTRREEALAKLSQAEREALGLPAGDPPKPAAQALPGRSRWPVLWHERARAYRSAVKALEAALDKALAERDEARKSEADRTMERDLTRQVADQAARDRDAAVASALRHRDEDQAAVLAAQDKARKLAEECDEARQKLAAALEGRDPETGRHDAYLCEKRKRKEVEAERDAAQASLRGARAALQNTQDVAASLRQERDEARYWLSRAVEMVKSWPNGGAWLHAWRNDVVKHLEGVPAVRIMAGETIDMLTKERDAARDALRATMEDLAKCVSGSHVQKAAQCAHGRVAGSCLVMGCSHHQIMAAAR